MSILKRADDVLAAAKTLSVTVNTLREENTSLRAEVTALRGVVEKVRERCGVLISPTNETGHTAKAIDAGLRETGKYILSLLPAVLYGSHMVATEQTERVRQNTDK